MTHTPDATTIRLTALDRAIGSYAHAPTSGRNDDVTENILKRTDAFHSFLTGSDQGDAPVSADSEDSKTLSGEDESLVEGDGPSVSAGPHYASDPYFQGAHSMLHQLIDTFNKLADGYEPSTQVSIAEVRRVVIDTLNDIHAAGPNPETTVEIGGVTMTQSQYDAARFPLLGNLDADRARLLKLGWNDAIDAALDGGNGYRDEATVSVRTVRQFVEGLRK